MIQYPSSRLQLIKWAPYYKMCLPSWWPQYNTLVKVFWCVDHFYLIVVLECLSIMRQDVEIAWHLTFSTCYGRLLPIHWEFKYGYICLSKHCIPLVVHRSWFHNYCYRVKIWLYQITFASCQNVMNVMALCCVFYRVIQCPIRIF